jgi:hypothetical protein
MALPNLHPDDPLACDFRNFVFALWQELGLPDPTRLQYDISLYLANGPRRRIIEAFRGAAKSWLTAAYVLWRLYRNPNERILVVSASGPRADAFAVFVKRLLDEVDWLNHLAPDPDQGHRDAVTAFDVNGSSPHQAPSVRSLGITGQLTGGRGTIIVADDVEVPKNSLTVLMREKLSESIKEFDAILVPGGEIIYLGTPQTAQSIYNSLPSRGYDMRVWPARYPQKPEVYNGRLAPMLVEDMAKSPSLQTGCSGRGAPTEPTRFPDVDLLEREASYGRTGFALQFMLDTSIGDANRFPLKLSDLIVMDLDKEMGPVKVSWSSSPECEYKTDFVVGLEGDRFYRPFYVSRHGDGTVMMSPYTGIAMYIDPSGRGDDETGYAVVAMLNGFLYVLACGGLPGGYDEATMTKLANIAKECKVRFIRIEDNFGDGMFTQLFKPYLTKVGHPCAVEGVHVTGQKELRICDTLEPVLNQHKLVIDTKLIEQDFLTRPDVGTEKRHEYMLFHQLTRMQRMRDAVKHDDRVEALQGAVTYWVEVMGKNEQNLEQEHRDRMLTEELKKFMKAAKKTVKEPSFFNSIMG